MGTHVDLPPALELRGRGRERIALGVRLLPSPRGKRVEVWFEVDDRRMVGLFRERPPPPRGKPALRRGAVYFGNRAFSVGLADAEMAVLRAAMAAARSGDGATPECRVVGESRVAALERRALPALHLIESGDALSDRAELCRAVPLTPEECAERGVPPRTALLCGETIPLQESVLTLALEGGAVLGRTSHGKVYPLPHGTWQRLAARAGA